MPGLLPPSAPKNQGPAWIVLCCHPSSQPKAWRLTGWVCRMNEGGSVSSSVWGLDEASATTLAQRMGRAVALGPWTAHACDRPGPSRNGHPPPPNPMWHDISQGVHSMVGTSPKWKQPKDEETEAQRGRAPCSSSRGRSWNSNAGLPAPEHTPLTTCTHSRGRRWAPGTYQVLFHGLLCIAQRLHSDVCPASRSEARSALCREECSWWPRPGSEKKGSLVGESCIVLHCVKPPWLFLQAPLGGCLGSRPWTTPSSSVSLRTQKAFFV
ncbi:uncharacterized protein LOC120603796 [Pteropus medius]|uniref:uncharacterized protein LOC120603796 n=1 Tax=Pteropus vampyrus TaxID=132908 RepID=UPI00196B8DFA|nr:uncharacterized protein LOC120603796 [Pteropus giganteus]